ncbi:MAG: hypothetical protein ABWX67_12795 [Allosphingosinicella sp.]
MIAAAAMAACDGADDARTPAPSQAAAQAEGKARPEETVEIGAVALRLGESDGRCRIAFAAGEAQADVEAPCFFLRRGGTVQRFAYPAQAVDAVVMIGGGAIDGEQRRHWGIDPKEPCGTRAQAVLVSGKTVTLGKPPLSGGVFCRNHGLDEKEFALAAERSGGKE